MSRCKQMWQVPGVGTPSFPRLWIRIPILKLETMVRIGILTHSRFHIELDFFGNLCGVLATVLDSHYREL